MTSTAHWKLMESWNQPTSWFQL